MTSSSSLPVEKTHWVDGINLAALPAMRVRALHAVVQPLGEACRCWSDREIGRQPVLVSRAQLRNVG